MKLFCKLAINLNRPTKFIFSASVIFLTLLLAPVNAISQGGHEHHSVETNQPGSEYRVNEKPMEHHHDDAGAVSYTHLPLPTICSV